MFAHACSPNTRAPLFDWGIAQGRVRPSDVCSEWQKNENIFLGQNFRACPPSQIFTVAPSSPRIPSTKVQGSPMPFRLSQVPQYWRSFDKDASQDTCPGSRVHSPGGGKGPRIPGCPLHAPAYAVIFIINWSAFLAILSFNSLITVAEKVPPTL